MKTLKPNVFVLVSTGRDEHVLPEVRAVDSTRAQPLPGAPRLLPLHGSRGHEGGLPVSGRSVSDSSLYCIFLCMIYLM